MRVRAEREKRGPSKATISTFDTTKTAKGHVVDESVETLTNLATATTAMMLVENDRSASTLNSFLVFIDSIIRDLWGKPEPLSNTTCPQGTGRVDIHTHPHTTAACAAGVETKTTDRDSLRYTHDGTRQLALGCESN